MSVFETILLGLSGIILLIVAFGIILAIIDRITGTTHYSCTIFGWHNGNGSTEAKFDGVTVHSTCSKCGQEVMQDSQGNWF